ncbi:Protein of unknown function DUF2985 [Phytophthora cactorum]|nr:Protein of unknown function DUF2985 [Phytophthora cactorum]
MTTIVLKASAGHQNEGIESGTRSAGYLSKPFPQVFVSKSATCATCEINASRAEAQERGEIQNSLAENEIEEIGDFIFLRDDVKYLRNTLSILNLCTDGIYVELRRIFASWIRYTGAASASDSLQRRWSVSILPAQKEKTDKSSLPGMLQFLTSCQVRETHLCRKRPSVDAQDHSEHWQQNRVISRLIHIALNPDIDQHQNTVMYQPNRTPAPATPILGDTYGHSSDPGWEQILASKIYNATLEAVVAIAGATLLLVQTGLLPVGDKRAQGSWVEIASQVMNGVFMWRAITSHPYYIVRLVMASRSVRHRGAIFDHELEAQSSDTKDMKSALESKEISRLGNFLFLRDEVKYIRTSLIILNCGCLFQYLMTAYMWSYNALTRPGFVMPALLPPTILCSVIGQRRLKKLSKKGEGRRMILADGVPVFRELSVTRKSESSL